MSGRVSIIGNVICLYALIKPREKKTSAIGNRISMRGEKMRNLPTISKSVFNRVEKKKHPATTIIILLLLVLPSLASISCGGMFPVMEELDPWSADITINDKATLIASRGIHAEDFRTAIHIYSSIDSLYNEHLILIYEEGDRPMAFSPDDQMIASGANVYTVETGQRIKKLCKPMMKASAVTFSNDSSKLAVGLYNGDVKVWSTETGKLLSGFKGHSGTITSLDFSADDKYLASGSLDKTAILWSVDNGEEIKRLVGFTEPVYQVDLSPDGTILAVLDKDGNAVLTKTESWKVQIKFDNIRRLKISRDSKYIATVNNDVHVKLWNIEDGQLVRTLSSHTQTIRDELDNRFILAFSKNNKYLFLIDNTFFMTQRSEWFVNPGNRRMVTTEERRKGNKRASKPIEQESGQVMIEFAGEYGTVGQLSRISKYFYDQDWPDLGKAYYQKAMEKKPEEAEDFYNLGRSRVEQKEYESAMEVFNQAIDIDPNKPEYYVSRAWLYHLMGNDTYAFKDYEKALDIDPKHSSAYNSRGYVYYKRQEYDKAIDEYKRAIKIKSTSFTYRTNLGSAYREKGEYEKALEIYSAILKNCQACSDQLVERGYTYYLMGDYDRAMEDYNLAIDRDSSSEWAYANRGLVYASQEYLVLALEDENKAISLNPEYAYAYTCRGNIYFNQKEYDKAVADLTKAVELDPKDSYSYNARGWLYYHVKKYKKCVEDASKAIEIFPDFAEAYDTRAWGFMGLGKYDEAIVDFKKATELIHEQANSHLGLGQAYFYLADYQSALNAINTAIEITPELPDAKEWKKKVEEKLSEE